jgi:hypothetical protein
VITRGYIAKTEKESKVRQNEIDEDELNEELDEEEEEGIENYFDEEES